MKRCFALLCLTMCLLALAAQAPAAVVAFHAFDDSAFVSRCVTLYPDSVTVVRFYGLECTNFYPNVSIQSGCTYCGDSPVSCTPAFAWPGDWVYTGSYWEAPVIQPPNGSEGCVCITPDYPMSDPTPLYGLDPVQDLHTPRCIAFFSAFALAIGPGMSPSQVPSLIVQNGCSGGTACNGTEPPDPIDQPHVRGPYYCAEEQSFRYVVSEFSPDDWLNTWACVTLDAIEPVEFRGFNLTPQDGAVMAEWSTASETAVDHFELHRDGGRIYSVAGTNTPTEHHYTYEDRSVVNGQSYRYELWLVNADGSRQSLASANATPGGSAEITTYALHQNYPNPFNPTTSISYDLVEAGHVSLKVFDVTGREVATLINGPQISGAHHVEFKAENLPSGLYFYRLTASSGFTATRKMLLLK